MQPNEYLDTKAAPTLRARVDALIAERDALAAKLAEVPQWISVEDRLPACNKKPNSHGVEVLIYPPHEGDRTAFYGRRVQDEASFYKYGAPINSVTHWQALPPAPAAIVKEHEE